MRAIAIPLCFAASASIQEYCQDANNVASGDVCDAHDPSVALRDASECAHDAGLVGSFSRTSGFSMVASIQARSNSRSMSMSSAWRVKMIRNDAIGGGG